MNNTVIKLFALVISVIPVSAIDYDVSGMDNDVDAALRLKTWVAEIGYTSRSTEKREGVFIDDDYRFVIFPRVTSKGLDRLVIYKTFNGKPSNVGSSELAKLINEINNRFNVSSVYVDSDGDLVLRFVLAFDDKVSPRLFRNTLEHAKDATKSVIGEFKPKLTPYFE